MQQVLCLPRIPRPGHRVRRLSLALLLTSGLCGCLESFEQVVDRSERQLPRLDPGLHPRVVVLAIDGLPGDLLVSEFQGDAASYVHLRRFFEEGTWVTNAIAPLPSLSVTGWLTIASGMPPGGRDGHGVSAFQWVARDEGRYYDLISPQFFSKDAIFAASGGESLFDDYPGMRVASYGFYHAPRLQEGMSLTHHGLLELGLGTQAEPLAIRRWRGSLQRTVAAGIDSPLSTVSERFAAGSRGMVTRHTRARELLDEARLLLDADLCDREVWWGIDDACKWADAAAAALPGLPLGAADQQLVMAIIAEFANPELRARSGLVDEEMRPQLLRAVSAVCSASTERMANLRTALPAAIEQARLGTLPVVSVLSSYDFDFLLHQHGVHDEVSLKELHGNADALAGAIFAAIAEIGRMDDTYFVLVSDHGASSTWNIAFVSDLLERDHGWKVKRLSILEQARDPVSFDLMPMPRDVFGYDAITASTGGGYLSIDLSVLERSYTKDGRVILDQWARHPHYRHLRDFLLHDGRRVDVIETLRQGLLEHPSVLVDGRPTFAHDQSLPKENVLDFFLVRARKQLGVETAVRVVSPAGQALIGRRRLLGAYRYSYEVLEGEDPLGYAEHPATSELVGAGRWSSDREWQERSARTPRKDILHRASTLMDSENSGTIVLFLARGWSGNALSHGRHGGALDAEMKATIAVIGPDIPRGGRVDCARLEDVRGLLAGLVGVPQWTRADMRDRVPLAQLVRSAPVRDYRAEIPYPEPPTREDGR